MFHGFQLRGRLQDVLTGIICVASMCVSVVCSSQSNGWMNRHGWRSGEPGGNPHR